MKDQILELCSQKEFVLLSIDGPCASGKTTLAKSLESEFDLNLIHTDDFFLPAEKRTPERLAEIGGNFDRERFFEEVLLPLSQNRPFSYRPYDCREGKLGKEIFVPKKKLSVIEGSYSQHPFFGDLYQLRLFLKISPEEQRKRLRLRDPKKLPRFLEEWIPKENAYFDAFSISEKADLVL